MNLLPGPIRVPTGAKSKHKRFIGRIRTLMSKRYSLLPLCLCNPQHEIYNYCSTQCYSKHSRPVSIIEPTLPSQPYALCSPVERCQCINHSTHRNQGEETSTYSPDIVTEIEKTNGEAAEDDGKIEPAQECPFVGEEDFGLNAGRQCDAFARGTR